MTDLVLRPFASDDLEWLVEVHGVYREAEGFDETFQPLVRSILDAFMADHDPACEAGWIATRGAMRLGSIFCVRHDAETAKLRLFLTLPEARGQGVGFRLLTTCTSFAREAGYRGMTLWTHESHRAACALYARNGWSCQSSKPVHSFGQDLVEQVWTLSF